MKLFQLVNTDNDPIGLYLVPEEHAGHFERLFQEVEKKFYEEDSPDIHEAVDNYLSEHYKIERTYIETEVASNHL